MEGGSVSGIVALGGDIIAAGAALAGLILCGAAAESFVSLGVARGMGRASPAKFESILEMMKPEESPKPKTPPLPY
jgi:hypothetical protein